MHQRPKTSSGLDVKGIRQQPKTRGINLRLITSDESYDAPSRSIMEHLGETLQKKGSKSHMSDTDITQKKYEALTPKQL